MMIEMQTILALADATAIGMWGVNLIATLCLAIVLNRVAASTRRFERCEDERNDKVEKLESNLHELTAKLVDERFRQMTHSIRNHVDGFARTLDELKLDLKERLQAGDEEMRQLLDGDHTLELKVEQKISGQRDWMLQNLATKDDVRRHELSVNSHLAKQDEQIQKLNVGMAVLAKKAN